MTRKGFETTSPRIVDFSHPILKGFSGLKTGYYKEEGKSITQQLWEDSESIAKECLNTDYIRGIKAGSLSANGYAQYSIQDCVYCSNATADYQLMISLSLAASRSDVAKFAMARYFEYQKYTRGILHALRIRDTSALTLSKEVEEYIEFERAIVSRVGSEEKFSPVYFIVAMIPCGRLWWWLAEKMTPTPSNVYNFWIVANRDDSSF